MIGTDTPGTNEAIRTDRGEVLFAPDLSGDAQAEIVGSVAGDPRGTAWRARLRARWSLRGAGNWSRVQPTQAATVYLAAADELTQRGRGDLAAHLRGRAREVAPWPAA